MQKVNDGYVLTFENRNGDPIIRKCGNCRFWKAVNKHTGYCINRPLLFAYSLEQNMFCMTSKFTLCSLHILNNEEMLQQESRPTEYDVEYMRNHNSSNS